MKITLGELRRVIQEEAQGLLSEEEGLNEQSEEEDAAEEKAEAKKLAAEEKAEAKKHAAEEKAEAKKAAQNEQNVSITLGQLRQIVREEYGNATSLREADDKEGNPAYKGAKELKALIAKEMGAFSQGLKGLFSAKASKDPVIDGNLHGKIKVNFVITAVTGKVKDAKVTKSNWTGKGREGPLTSKELKKISDWIESRVVSKLNQKTFGKKPTAADGDIDVAGYGIAFDPKK